MSRLDKVAYTSLHDTYLMFSSYTCPFVITGTLNAGKMNRYQAIFNVPNQKARGRTSIIRHDTGLRSPFNASYRIANYSPDYEIYRFAGAEIAFTNTFYTDATTFIVEFRLVNNTASPITLIDQQLDVVIDFYNAPVA